jgi:hypothetical protein
MPDVSLPKLLTGGGFLGNIINSIFGGKSKVTDEGVMLLAGSLNQAIEGTLTRAFQEVQYKKWVFGSTKTREELLALGNEASAQIGLVFQAIGDTVREGALALGMNAVDVQTAMDQYRISALHISLKGLSAEDAQAELEAVFSQIFDNLAESVIPFLGQFQQVGEGLGETLVRVATSVQVMQESIKQLGLAVDVADPEQFAQISVALIELAGGIDEFISKMQSFVSKFATDEHKIAIATDALLRGFASVGLTLPDTADGLWELMQSLDATTEAGRGQIAMLLDLTDSADTYYKMLADAEKKRIAAEEGIENDRLAAIAEQTRLQQEADRIRLDAFNVEIDALLEIQTIAEGLDSLLTSLYDMILADISTSEDNYARSRAEAERLADALIDMTDPVMIDDTVRRIEQLTRAAYGVLDKDQTQAMGQEFLDFIVGIRTLAAERLRISTDEKLANTAFTPEEILSKFNELVTDPMILVAEKWSSVADRLLTEAPADFSIQGPVIAEAVRAGMQAGATAMAEAAVELAGAVISTANSGQNSSQAIAGAIASLPSRIEVKITPSEFA